MKFLIRPIIKFPYLTVIIITAITVYFGWNLQYLTVDNDVNSMLPDDHPVKISQNKIKAQFALKNPKKNRIRPEAINNGTLKGKAVITPPTAKQRNIIATK